MGKACSSGFLKDARCCQSYGDQRNAVFRKVSDIIRTPETAADIEAEVAEEGKKAGRIDWILVNPARMDTANLNGAQSKPKPCISLETRCDLSLSPMRRPLRRCCFRSVAGVQTIPASCQCVFLPSSMYRCRY